MGNKVHLLAVEGFCPTPTLQVEDPPSFFTCLSEERSEFGFTHVLHLRISLAFQGAIYDLRWCMKNHYETFLCHLRYTSAFVGHLLLLSGIATVLFLPLSF